ncbi:hypothetical protein FB446DRAFT_816839 [Lentinula raphanica]|nr:hypothetical protein FB446DRAFT_816839 [Lentinula raphanica]
MLCDPSWFIESNKELIVDIFSLFFATMAIIDSFCLPGSPLFSTRPHSVFSRDNFSSATSCRENSHTEHGGSPKSGRFEEATKASEFSFSLGGPDTTRYEISRLPELINIFSTMIQSIPNGPPLKKTYIEVILELEFSHIEEARRLLTQLAPFVTKRNSTVLYTTVADAIDDVWSKLDKSTISIKLKLTTHNSFIHSVSSPPGLTPSSPSPLSSPSSVAVDVASHPPPLPESLLVPPHPIRTGPYKTHPVVSHKNFFSAMSCREISRIDRRGNLKVT